MKDLIIKDKIDQNKNMAVPFYLMMAYAYYVQDAPFASDNCFDETAKFILDNWDEIEHRHKSYLTKDALKAVAQKAILRKTGARGLRSIIEEVLLETMFDLPSIEGVEEVMLNKEVIHGKIKPLLIYSKGSALSSEKEKKIAN